MLLAYLLSFQVLKQAFAAGLVSDGQRWIDLLRSAT
jgi:hypothetical protein